MKPNIFYPERDLAWYMIETPINLYTGLPQMKRPPKKYEVAKEPKKRGPYKKPTSPA